MNTLLLQLDGKLPNLALMRLAAHHRSQGDTVVLRRAANERSVQPQLGDPEWERVYGSLIFESTKPVAEVARKVYPGIVLGGTGWNLDATLEKIGVRSLDLDYADYPLVTSSFGFSQRGCRLRCAFCVVPRKEGKPVAVGNITDIWRGDPWPRHIHLLDNDFFGVPEWRSRIDELQTGAFRVSFTQGINARMLTDETAAAVASVDYRDDSMKVKRVYTAWDNRKDEARLFAGLKALVKHGVKPDHIMVYTLIGYWPGETAADRDYRRARLREFGARPYPMPFVRSPELLGFQRWVIGAYDKSVTWAEWERARYRPEKLSLHSSQVELSAAEEVSAGR